MKKIEYHHVEYTHYPSAADINLEGIEGWEFVHILHIKKDYLYSNSARVFTKEIYKVTFKREICIK